jgi:hypothetical protein
LHEKCTGTDNFLQYNNDWLKSFNEAYLAATAANDTARNSDAGNDENNSNPKVEIFIGKIIFSLLVSIFFTFANRGGQ